MANTWQVKLYSAAGALLALVDDYASFSLRRQVNSAGAFALRFAKAAAETDAAFEARCALWVLDAPVEFWERDTDAGMTWRLEFEGLVRWSNWYVTADGALVYEVGGRGYIDLNALLEEPEIGEEKLHVFKTIRRENNCPEFRSLRNELFFFYSHLMLPRYGAHWRLCPKYCPGIPN